MDVLFIGYFCHVKQSFIVDMFLDIHDMCNCEHTHSHTNIYIYRERERGGGGGGGGGRYIMFMLSSGTFLVLFGLVQFGWFVCLMVYFMLKPSLYKNSRGTILSVVKNAVWNMSALYLLWIVSFDKIIVIYISFCFITIAGVEKYQVL